MLQAVLLEFLRESLDEWGYELPPGKGSLICRYRDFFSGALDINWSAGPVPFETLEDLTLARNSVQHETIIASRYAQQTKDHARRFPDSLFGDPWRFRRIIVTQGSLDVAVSAVDEFCRFVDTQLKSKLRPRPPA
jgi:hypothetical protein